MKKPVNNRNNSTKLQKNREGNQKKNTAALDIKKPSMPTKGGDSAWRVGNLIIRGYF